MFDAIEWTRAHDQEAYVPGGGIVTVEFVLLW